MKRQLDLVVIQGLASVVRSCANLTAAGHCEAAHEDALLVFLQLGVQLGIPEVVLRQLVNDANDYDSALANGQITLDREPATSGALDLRAEAS